MHRQAHYGERRRPVRAGLQKNSIAWCFCRRVLMGTLQWLWPLKPAVNEHCCASFRGLCMQLLSAVVSFARLKLTWDNMRRILLICCGIIGSYDEVVSGINGPCCRAGAFLILHRYGRILSAFPCRFIAVIQVLYGKS